ncbi:hypothetical protein GQX74_005914 [Glossina fuscipes]|nr:hypothetical protein GQX74_005914 [Glossina fuscipes]
MPTAIYDNTNNLNIFKQCHIPLPKSWYSWMEIKLADVVMKNAFDYDMCTTERVPTVVLLTDVTLKERKNEKQSTPEELQLHKEWMDKDCNDIRSISRSNFLKVMPQEKYSTSETFP